MRIVVFSDSHRDYFPLQRIVLAQPTAEVFLHLGDGEEEFEQLRRQFPTKLMRGVAGNCDWGSIGRKFDFITCEGKRIFFTHGHLYGVKTGLSSLLQAARGMQADIALYGHTHIHHTGYVDGMYILNPGSVSSPRDGHPSYGVIDITPAGIVTNIITRGKGVGR